MGYESKENTKTNITEKVITVSLQDLGAISFDDNIEQKIIDYAIANNITKEPNQLHRWVITDEQTEEGQPETVLIFGDNQTLIFGDNQTLIIPEEQTINNTLIFGDNQSLIIDNNNNTLIF
jgi:hypothetical protein